MDNMHLPDRDNEAVSDQHIVTLIFNGKKSICYICVSKKRNEWCQKHLFAVKIVNSVLIVNCAFLNTNFFLKRRLGSH